MSKKNILFALFVCMMSGAAEAQQPRSELAAPPELANPNPEDLKSGAVLCSWMIFLAAKEVGDRCFQDKDSKLQAVLDESIARIDQFIIDNAPVSRDELAQSKAARISSALQDSICSKDSLQLYEAFRKAGPDETYRNVTKLLAVPRKPVINPCL